MDEDGGYNDSNRAFLQAFLARNTMTYEEAKPILAAIFTVHGMPSSSEATCNRLICFANELITARMKTIRLICV